MTCKIINLRSVYYDHRLILQKFIFILLTLLTLKNLSLHLWFTNVVYDQLQQTGELLLKRDIFKVLFTTEMYMETRWAPQMHAITKKSTVTLQKF